MCACVYIFTISELILRRWCRRGFTAPGGVSFWAPLIAQDVQTVAVDTPTKILETKAINVGPSTKPEGAAARVPFSAQRIHVMKY